MQRALAGAMAAATAAFVMIISGCGGGAMVDSSGSSVWRDVWKNVPPAPALRRNPNPTAYEMTLTVHDAPGPFAVAQGFMQYETKLQDHCGPDMGGMSGTRRGLKENIPFDVEQISPGVFRGVVYTDLVESHDYFGLGICHVPMVAARIVLWPTGLGGEKKETRFVESMSTKEIIAGNVRRSGFLRRHYPDGGFRDAPAMAFREGTSLRGQVNESELFNIEIRVRKLD